MIVNQQNSTAELSQRELVDLYMGKNQSFPGGGPVTPIDQMSDSTIRERFYKTLVNKSVAQVNAYWARLLFTGRVKPPKAVANSEEVLLMVQNNPRAIGYIDSDHLDASVKEVFRVQ